MYFIDWNNSTQLSFDLLDNLWGSDGYNGDPAGMAFVIYLSHG